MSHKKNSHKKSHKNLFRSKCNRNEFYLMRLLIFKFEFIKENEKGDFFSR